MTHRILRTPKQKEPEMPNNLDSNLKILFWNIRSYKPRREEIEKKINNLDILICVESWLKNPDPPNNRKKERRNVDPKFPGFKTFRKDRDYGQQGGGILIFIRNNVGFKEITSVKSPHQFVEICGIEITNTNPNFSIITCYRAKGKLTQDQWNSK